jgi:adenylate cyclase
VEYFRLQAIVACSLIVGASGFPFAVAFELMGHRVQALVVLWTFVLFYFIPLFIYRGGASNIAAHACSANFYQCHLSLCLLFGGVSAPNMMWFTGLPIVSVLIGGVRHGFFWGGIAAITISVVYLLEATGVVAFHPVLTADEHLLIHTTGMVGLLIAIFGSAVAYEGLKDASLARRRRIEKQLVQANEGLKELDAQKTSFFQNISHELRTPLTLIMNPLDAALQRDPQNDHLSVASKNARRLLRLVNQLLDFQKLRSGKRTMRRMPIELRQFVQTCGDYFRVAAESKRLKFRMMVNGLPINEAKDTLWVQSDVDALEKILFNFLSNALKFTPYGGAIDVVLSGDAAQVRLAVKDTGPGISIEGQEKLFQVFSQVDNTTTRAFEGSGLGLALAKVLAEELDGTMGVDSVEGQGSTFWVEFPGCEPGNATDGLPTDFEVRDWLLSDDGETGAEQDEDYGYDDDDETAGPTVLVIDDLADMRTVVSSTLRRHGYRVITASNGMQGVDLAMLNEPDIVITDWMMPKMSGPEVIAELASDDRLRSIPVVLLTAKSDEESKLIGTESGAAAFLGKPFNEQELVSTVRNLVALKAREREVDALNRMLTETVLKRYLPPELVENIVAGELSMETPELRTVTILFSDICDFTKISDALGPEGIASLLNEYLSAMTQVVFAFGGTIDKFVGDAVMVIFGAPLEMSPVAQANRAVRCAVRMQQEMDLLADQCIQRGLPPLQMRIGVHQGQAVVGNFGSPHRADYTCIGPMVNVASRIESACEPGSVLFSDSVRMHLDGITTEDTGEHHLKGVSERLRLYRYASSRVSDEGRA